MKKVFILLIVMVFGIGLGGCNKKETNFYESKIENISQIEDNEERIIEIMKLKKDISKLSANEKNSIDNHDILDDLELSTCETLKNSVQWCDYLNREVNYYELNELVATEKNCYYEVCKEIWISNVENR